MLGGHERAYVAVGGSSLGPALAIQVKNRDGSLGPKIAALLDSGADVSTFPASWAKSIGIKLDESMCDKDEAHTAGGPTTIWRYPAGLHVLIDDIDHWVKADFCEALMVPLLGRTDFFSNYRVMIDERRETFTLTAYGPDEPARTAAN